jgi:hypothetical protein
VKMNPIAAAATTAPTARIASFDQNLIASSQKRAELR